MRIAICEDDKEQRTQIRQLIRNYRSREITAIDEYHNGELLISAYKKGIMYDIIFLDIEMDEINGIEVAEFIGSVDSKVLMIIVTSVLEYAIEGYSVNAYDFILKPIDEKRFSSIMQKSLLYKKNEKNSVYKIECRDRTEYLSVAHIHYVESDKKKVNIFYKDKFISSNENISLVEKKLSAMGFVRISRFYLINIANLKEIGSSNVELKNGESLKYSKKYEEEIKNVYMNYIIGETL